MSDCVCDKGASCHCVGFAEDEKLRCEHWHMPAPRILHDTRSNYLTDLRDQGNARQREIIGSPRNVQSKLNYSRTQKNARP